MAKMKLCTQFVPLLLISQVLKGIISASTGGKLHGMTVASGQHFSIMLLCMPRRDREVSPCCSVGVHSVTYLQGSQPWKFSEVLTQECV